MPIRVAIAGVGNCASSLVQGVCHYRDEPGEVSGLMHTRVGGHRVGDITFVAAFDVDARKVGVPLSRAIFALPNDTMRFVRQGDLSLDPDPLVQMGPVLDGVAPHMRSVDPSRTFVVASHEPVDVARVLREQRVEVLVNYMPVGAQQASEHYAQACLDAGVCLVNCVPCFIASDPTWSARFRERRVACVGDDIKAQVGATITHRALAHLFAQRGARIRQTYQLNVGGNTDFLNMLARDRLDSKKISKTDAVQAQLGEPLAPQDIHIGPSDYVSFLHDRKVCHLRIDATGFGGAPIELDLKLTVEDSPNSAAVVVDAIRAARVARDRGFAGPVESASSWTMKHPPTQVDDDEALRAFRAEFDATPDD